MIQSFIDQIPFLQEGNVHIDQIHKGYSIDCKFIVIRDLHKYLLRTFDQKYYPAKQQEFEALRKMQEYDVACSRPLEIGTIGVNETGYMILSYMEGRDGSEVLPELSSTDQYNIGVEAGAELLKIHRLQAPADIPTWYERKVEKHRNYIDRYNQLNVRIPNDLRVISFIEDHLHLMKHRPSLFQHDDFHVGNLIIQDNKLSGVLDFDRWDWGDPIHEFLKVGMFSSEVSIPFSIGQIRRYHRDTEPDDMFWRLYSLYLAMCLISSIVWITDVKPEETQIMMDKINRVMEDHNSFDLVKPKWYP